MHRVNQRAPSGVVWLGTRFYVTSAIALTISAFAGVLLGAIIAMVRNEQDRAAPNRVIVVEVPVTPSTSPASEIQHAGRLPPPAQFRQEIGDADPVPRTSRTGHPTPPTSTTTVPPTDGEEESTSPSSPTSDEPQPPTSSSRPGTSTPSHSTTPGDENDQDGTTTSTWPSDGDEPNEPSSTGRSSDTRQPDVPTGVRADAAARP